MQKSLHAAVESVFGGTGGGECWGGSACVVVGGQSESGTVDRAREAIRPTGVWCGWVGGVVAMGAWVLLMHFINGRQHEITLDHKQTHTYTLGSTDDTRIFTTSHLFPPQRMTHAIYQLCGLRIPATARTALVHSVHSIQQQVGSMGPVRIAQVMQLLGKVDAAMPTHEEATTILHWVEAAVKDGGAGKDGGGQHDGQHGGGGQSGDGKGEMGGGQGIKQQEEDGIEHGGGGNDGGKEVVGDGHAGHDGGDDKGVPPGGCRGGGDGGGWGVGVGDVPVQTATASAAHTASGTQHAAVQQLLALVQQHAGMFGVSCFLYMMFLCINTTHTSPSLQPPPMIHKHRCTACLTKHPAHHHRPHPHTTTTTTICIDDV